MGLSPIFVSVDDTVLSKMASSSKTKSPTQGAGWHYSHLEGKVVYRHQVHAAIVGTGNASLCYSLKRPCCPERESKNRYDLGVRFPSFIFDFIFYRIDANVSYII